MFVSLLMTANPPPVTNETETPSAALEPIHEEEANWWPKDMVLLIMRTKDRSSSFEFLVHILSCSI